ncbi:alpha/beta fold hydrolase [Noviherbaspirillum galbum]|uniref:Alpha/beta hydrolase n=1 Tax=Noviherbaspirillum galbum TaxID=2709383 RepID=A0A6B3SZV0_9BURK|nr:alpha/beta hydrolase [Noviherbaspirillum galbum]NEX64689.1 alpha/beta hydrolase [Noviherbaspirillum galbum]
MNSLPYGYHVRANGVRLHLMHYAGNGPRLLLLPGITSPAITWGFVGARLARHFDVHILDFRGRGLSYSEPGMVATLDAMAADVLGLLEAQEWSSVTLLGHSMGARVAIRAAARDAERIGELLLIDPPVSGPGRRPYPYPLSWYIDSIRLAIQGTTAEALRPFAPTWTEEQLRLRAEWLHTCNEDAITQAHLGFHDDDIHSDLPRLRTPGLLMAAGRGDVMRPEDLAEFRTLAPGLAQCVAAGTGHMIPWDDEKEFFRLLGDFLRVDLLDR